MYNVVDEDGTGARLSGTGGDGFVARLGTSGHARASGRRWRAFALLVVAYFITIVDFTIVNVALPTIGRSAPLP